MHKVALLIVLGLTLSACSTIKIFYGFADDFIQREVADHLDLDEQDLTVLAAQSADLVAWHRREMLPDYATFLSAQADLLERGNVTPSEIKSSFGNARALLEATVAGLAPRAAIVLARHTGPDKLGHLERRLAERMTERKERSAQAPADRIERRTKRLVKNFERFLGDLDDRQASIVEAHVKNTLNDSARFLDHRRRRERAFMGFMKAQPAPEKIGPFFENLLVRSHEIVEPDYKAFADGRARKFQGLLFEIISSLTPPQRTAAVERLRGFAEDFADLAGRIL